MLLLSTEIAGETWECTANMMYCQNDVLPIRCTANMMYCQYDVLCLPSCETKVSYNAPSSYSLVYYFTMLYVPSFRRSNTKTVQ